jgi:hypothetical protein
MKRVWAVLKFLGWLLISPILGLAYLQARMEISLERFREKNGYFVHVRYDGGESEALRFPTRNEAEAAVSEYCKMDYITVDVGRVAMARRRVRGAYIV